MTPRDLVYELHTMDCDLCHEAAEEIKRLRAELAEHTPELITFSLAINLETYLNQGDAPMDRKGRQLAEEALANYKALRGEKP